MRASTATLSVLIACTVGAIAPAALAQGATGYPTKPIRLIIPFAPGGASISSGASSSRAWANSPARTS